MTRLDFDALTVNLADLPPLHRDLPPQNLPGGVRELAAFGPRRGLMSHDLTLARPGCTTAHRNLRTMIGCLLPGAAWVMGRGQWATLAPDACALTVQLHHDRDTALAALRMIDATGCGGFCSGRHYLGHADLDTHSLTLAAHR